MSPGADVDVAMGSGVSAGEATDGRIGAPWAESPPPTESAADKSAVVPNRPRRLAPTTMGFAILLFEEGFISYSVALTAGRQWLDGRVVHRFGPLLRPRG
jgi:hypothetical protein